MQNLKRTGIVLMILGVLLLRFAINMNAATASTPETFWIRISLALLGFLGLIVFGLGPYCFGFHYGRQAGWKRGERLGRHKAEEEQVRHKVQSSSGSRCSWPPARTHGGYEEG